MKVMLSVRCITVKIICSDSSLTMLMEQIVILEVEKIPVAQLRYYKPDNLI